jgi:hypothetical protein
MKIQVLNNKAELLHIIETQQLLGEDYSGLYRCNVNAGVTELELAFIDVGAQRRAIAAAIWQNNNKGIIKQSPRRTAQLKRFIMQLCGIRSRITMAAIINKINDIENGRR